MENNPPSDDVNTYLAVIARQIEREYDVEIVGAGKRSTYTSEARRVFTYEAMDRGFTRAQIARFLGINWSSVDYLAHIDQIV